MSRRPLIVILLVSALVGGILFWTFQRQVSPRSVPESFAATNQEPIAQPQASVNSAVEALLSAKTKESRRQATAQLRALLQNSPTSLGPIREILDSHRDAPTGEGFRIATQGFLLEAPTLRTLLLDKMGTVDPAAAAAYAREILRGSDSPDEWALALRNLARGDSSSEARALLETKMDELLHNASWQREPSAGYLEAFDTAVYLGGTRFLQPLSELLSKKDNQAVAHASFLTLDRLIIKDPTPALTSLMQHPEWMQGRPETRADFFARADIGNADQRRIIEAYLRNPNLTPGELEAFAGIFPNANYMISRNLLTESTVPNATNLRDRDRAALATVNQWLADPAFENLKRPLGRIQKRLTDFVTTSASER